MAARRAPAVPRKAVAKRAPINGAPTTDLVGVRMTALNYARSLWGSPEIGSAGEPVASATKVVTQAKRFERYILGTTAGDDA